MSKGVEWAVHACTLLAAVPAGRGARAEALARFHGVPAAYMAKQLQALSRAGLVQATRGLQGGYRLARPIDAISLWDVVAAIDGHAPAFRCTEIRRNGPCGLSPAECRTPCPVNAAFLAAEEQYRAALAATSLAAIAADVVAGSSPQHLLAIGDWIARETIECGPAECGPPATG